MSHIFSSDLDPILCKSLSALCTSRPHCAGEDASEYCIVFVTQRLVLRNDNIVRFDLVSSIRLDRYPNSAKGSPTAPVRVQEGTRGADSDTGAERMNVSVQDARCNVNFDDDDAAS
ncbi:hypothetical protein NUW54_g10390 [Trametes sanguinea]|uniref:Uncharacterized protein n=1 Tax=Trametes sanguinea TaxID=158606 RepID=A0ACC1P0N6_9APHY|nr:hypothetical protein NUW54_g10390 [Trametes sanguinea]